MLKTLFSFRSIRAFTLIELLVVVGVIAILATIGLVNYQQAVMRSKVAIVKSDHRVIATALESYRVDNKMYPEDYAEYHLGANYGLGRLTSPIAYLSSVPLDACGGYIESVKGRHIISYTLGTEPNDQPTRWILTSAGPNQIDETSPAFGYPGFSADMWENPESGVLYIRYDATNGTTSAGDIIRVSDANPGGLLN